MGEIDVGRKVSQQIPPGIFWRSQVFIDHPMYLKFNVSLSKDALVGIYGRRGLPPSHTQVSHSGHPAHRLLTLIHTSSLIHKRDSRAVVFEALFLAHFFGIPFFHTSFNTLTSNYQALQSCRGVLKQRNHCNVLDRVSPGPGLRTTEVQCLSSTDDHLNLIKKCFN